MEPVDILLAAVKLVSMQALPRTCYGKGFFGGPTMVQFSLPGGVDHLHMHMLSYQLYYSIHRS